MALPNPIQSQSQQPSITINADGEHATISVTQSASQHQEHLIEEFRDRLSELRIALNEQGPEADALRAELGELRTLDTASAGFLDRIKTAFSKTATFSDNSEKVFKLAKALQATAIAMGISL